MLTSNIGDSSGWSAIAAIVANKNEFLIRLGYLLRLLGNLIVVYDKNLITVIRL